MLENAWDSIHGYTSNVVCPICNLDILVKTGQIDDTVWHIVWALCHVCFDKGWRIPKYSPDYQKLIYKNVRTNEVKLIKIIR